MSVFDFVTDNRHFSFFVFFSRSQPRQYVNIERVFFTQRCSLYKVRIRIYRNEINGWIIQAIQAFLFIAKNFQVYDRFSSAMKSSAKPAEAEVKKTEDNHGVRICISMRRMYFVAANPSKEVPNCSEQAVYNQGDSCLQSNAFHQVGKIIHFIILWH